MPDVVCRCGAGRGYGHAEGCLWRNKGHGDPMSVKCVHPGCYAEPGAPCIGRKTSGVHMARERSVNPDDPLRRIGVVMSLIARRGREGGHNEDDVDCGCGRCCAGLVKGVLAHIEGENTATENRLARSQKPQKRK